MRPTLAACLMLLALGSRLGAFVTSATLELSYPHPTKIYLNGTEIKNYDSQFTHVFEYILLCSADGSLPLELFKYKKDNMLAFHQKGKGGWHEFTNMGISYRLTAYQSAGDPIVVWSEPENTRMLHLPTGQGVPEGWNKVGFDDSKWQEGVNARMITDYWGWPELVDPAFKGFLGNEGYVPFLSHNKRGDARADMINLYRSVFRVPDKPGKLVLYSQAKSAKRGDKIPVRLIPARDVASAGNVQFSAVLPRGFDPIQAPGASFDAATRRVVWNYPSPAKSLNLHMAAVAENKGFVLPNRALGPWKANRPPSDYIRNMSKTEYYESADFPSGASAWFKMSPPPFSDGPAAPIILSVTFQSQILPRGFNGLISYTQEYMMFNYSVDGSLRGSKPGDGVNVTKTMGSQSGQYWTNGYYDATYDRRWTWSDLAKLNVRFYAKQVGDRKLDNKLLSCIANVRYYNPADVAPLLYGQVSEAGCANLTITASMQSLSNDITAQAEPVVINVFNPAACAPTPTPTFTRVPTKAPTPKPGLPTHTPVPTPTQTRGIALAPVLPGFKEVNSQPEPFKRGGVFVYFTIGRAVTSLYLHVYNATGQKVVSVDGGAFGPGKNQVFFNGLDDKKKALPPGRYQYELEGRVGELKESFRGNFTKASDKYK